jgi:hypothetical protein
MQADLTSLPDYPSLNPLWSLADAIVDLDTDIHISGDLPAQQTKVSFFALYPNWV